MLDCVDLKVNQYQLIAGTANRRDKYIFGSGTDFALSRNLNFLIRQRPDSNRQIRISQPQADAAIRAEVPGNRHQLAMNLQSFEQRLGPDSMAVGMKEQNDHFWIHLLLAFANEATASRAQSISASVVKKPGAKRTEPAGKVPKVLCAAGAQ